MIKSVQFVNSIAHNENFKMRVTVRDVPVDCMISDCGYLFQKLTAFVFNDQHPLFKTSGNADEVVKGAIWFHFGYYTSRAKTGVGEQLSKLRKRFLAAEVNGGDDFKTHEFAYVSVAYSAESGKDLVIVSKGDRPRDKDKIWVDYDASGNRFGVLTSHFPNLENAINHHVSLMMEKHNKCIENNVNEYGWMMQTEQIEIEYID